MSLKDKLIARIRVAGPIGLDDYMTACLHDPVFGYYATRPRLGEDGDFITAPLVSQMFGELIGLWAVETWTQLGKPSPFRLVEVGPGDGTLMVDALRAARLAPDFLSAADLWLVETSAPLAARQRERLDDTPAHWAASLDEVPGEAPVILLANEVLDCLPTRQGIAVAGGAVERLVGRGAQGRLAFTRGGPVPLPPANGGSPSDHQGVVFEWSEAAAALGRQVGGLVMSHGGAALFLDYARDGDRWGDTLQAIKDHRRCDPLHSPGCADLTAHADFPSFAAGARESGAQVTPIVGQGAFLRGLGVEVRADALARARPDKADTILRQLRRLVSTEGMGTLFKVVCVHSPAVSPPGFEVIAT